MGWNYQGPLHPSYVVGCDSCMAAKIKQCMSRDPRHPTRTEGCGLCDAAASGICPGHGIGLSGALDSYMAGMDEDQKAAFATTRAFIDSKVAVMPEDAVVKITINEYLETIPDEHGESLINVQRVRGKAHWNMAI